MGESSLAKGCGSSCGAFVGGGGFPENEEFNEDEEDEGEEELAEDEA